jgi:hypothetical protein
MRRPAGMVARAGLVLGLCVLGACGGSVSPEAVDAGRDANGGGDGGGQDSSSPTDSAAHDSGMASDTSIILTDAAMRVPQNHRPDDSQCTQPAPPGDCNGGMGGPGGSSCSKDTDCTMGPNPRCETDGPLPGCMCTFDACVTDTDCMMGEVCACHGSAYSTGGNQCIPSNCRVDSDCGPSGYCSPTTGQNNCGAVTGYYCHTSSDACLNDGDCGAGQVCQWSAASNHWQCAMALLCAWRQ